MSTSTLSAQVTPASDAAVLAGIAAGVASGDLVTYSPEDATTVQPAPVSRAPYRLTQSGYRATVAKVEAVNGRCRKLGIPEVTLTASEVTVWCRYTESGERLISEEPQDAPWFARTMVDVTVTGGRPRIDGYTLLASVEWLEGGAIVRTVPDMSTEDVDRDALVPGRCDHCGIDRRRVKVYLVREEVTGRVLQVGTTCARDFLGMSVTPVFDSIVTQRDDEESWGWGGGACDAPTVIAVAAALADVAEHGFVPASAHGRVPTRDVVRDTLWPGKDDRGVPPAAVEAQIGRATEIIAHFRDTDDMSDFALNLRAIARSEDVTDREIGYVAAMPAAYDRAIGRALKRQAADAERAVSKHLGAVGERLEVTGTVRTVLDLEPYSYYGPAPRMVILATDEGDLVKWTTTAAIRSDLHVGTRVRLEGPVKAHDDGRYGKQTVIGGKGGRVKATILEAA